MDGGDQILAQSERILDSNVTSGQKHDSQINANVAARLLDV